MVVKIQVMVFCIVIPCSVVEGYRKKHKNTFMI